VLKTLKILATVFGLLVLAAPSAAQTPAYPAKPVHLIVPFSAGSATDIVARAIGDKLAASLGQSVIVDNRPGAGGTIGAAVVAAAAPDGYTLLVNSSGHTVNPHIYANLPYDTLRDFAGVSTLANLPNVLIVAPGRGISSVAQLIALAKAKPGQLNYASAGSGSATHMNAEKFRVAAGIDAVHIPFKGTPEGITEVIAGRVDYFFAPLVAALPLIKDGKVLALAVGSAKRSSALPDVPTTLEAGVPGSDYNFWIGMLAPAKTPREVILRLNQDVQKALQSPEVRERLLSLGAEPMAMAPAQFDAYIRDEYAANARIVKAAGIKAN
jgi:tripartite-type tricarboxylate transporter receptor subunit TctC